MSNFSKTADELENIQAQMLELLEQAHDLVRGTPEQNYAEAYWLPAIECALTDDHSYLSRDENMSRSIHDLRHPQEDDDE